MCIRDRRYAGFVDEMEKHHVDIRPEWILSGDYSAESGYRGMQALLKRAQKPTAVISASDAVAFGAMRAAPVSYTHLNKIICTCIIPICLFRGYLLPCNRFSIPFFYNNSIRRNFFKPLEFIKTVENILHKMSSLIKIYLF